MFAVGCGKPGVLGMELMRAGDVDHFHMAVGNQRVERIVRRRIEIARELCARRLAGVARSNQLHPRVPQESGQHQRKRATESGHADPQRG